MKLDRNNLNGLMATVVNPKSNFWNLTEAIKREAFFTREITARGFTKREMYMMMDILYRPGQPVSVIKAVDGMLDRRGITDD